MGAELHKLVSVEFGGTTQGFVWESSEGLTMTDGVIDLDKIKPR